MAVVFVSHSSKDDALAGALETWLRANGFTDVFVDHQHIAGGAKWREELRAAAGACRVVVCLVTANWLASNECFNEFRAAWYMGKRIIPLFGLAPAALGDEAKHRLHEVAAEDQGIDLIPCLAADQTLDLAADPSIADRLSNGLRAAGALTRIGLDPEAFAIDRALRPTPFPGLGSFGDDDADAALFYGRSREIAEVLEELRKVRAERDLRPFVILGASGAGKSSLLKAGIIPRLRREAPAWLPLRAFRPGADPLLNFAEALTRTLADFGTVGVHGAIRDRLFAVWRHAERQDGELSQAGHTTLETALEAEGRKLRAAAGREGATILVSIDQAEELARAEDEGAQALVDYLHAALSSGKSPWQLVFTIRTDSFPELQKHRRFQELKARGYDLRAVPVFRFESVVEEPAKRYGVRIEAELIAALIGDAPEQDALPLLAFALQRLWRRYAAAGVISNQNYQNIGGLKQLIEDAGERALHGIAPEQDVPLPSGPLPTRRAELGAATFVPALAQLNEQGAVIRRAAPWDSFTDEQQQLLLGFDQWRLVVRKATEADSGTVEVAHESLFREWSRLEGWLEPERARLEALRSLQVDASTWDRNGRNGAFLNHRDYRLVEAGALAALAGYRKRLDAVELDYLAACRKADTQAKRARRLLQGGIYAALIAIIVGLVGWINQATIASEWRFLTVAWPYQRANFRPFVLSAVKEQALKPKDGFRECIAAPRKDVCPAMVVVPAGSFIMGSLPTPKNRSGDEEPLHRVTIAQSFAVSKHELTFDEWDACVATGGCNGHQPTAQFGRGDMPVINVTWRDAQQYVAWLAQMTGKHYRLLSEAEYEYATRAGTTTAYPWGDEITLKGMDMANCKDCGDLPWEGVQTAPVGSFQPNKFGLHDMVGNVFEWTEDCEHVNYKEAPTDGSAWLAGNRGDCSTRIARGGSWSNGSDQLRSASRYWFSAGQSYNFLGFRVARTLSAP